LYLYSISADWDKFPEDGNFFVFFATKVIIGKERKLAEELSGQASMTVFPNLPAVSKYFVNTELLFLT